LALLSTWVGAGSVAKEILKANIINLKHKLVHVIGMNNKLNNLVGESMLQKAMTGMLA
jgi:hypothetical protein